MQREGLSGDNGVVRARPGDDENFAVGIAGIGAHGHGRPYDGRNIQAGVKIGSIFCDDDCVTRGMVPMTTGKRTGRSAEMRPK